MSVYFIRMGENGPIKIGVSDQPHLRLKSLSPYSPYDLIPLGVMDGDEAEERALHRKFRKLRENGEWFEPHQDLLDFITANTVPFPVRKSKRAIKREGLRSFSGDISTETNRRFWTIFREGDIAYSDLVEEAVKDFCDKIELQTIAE